MWTRRGGCSNRCISPHLDIVKEHDEPRLRNSLSTFYSCNYCSCDSARHADRRIKSCLCSLFHHCKPSFSAGTPDQHHPTGFFRILGGSNESGIESLVYAGDAVL